MGGEQALRLVLWKTQLCIGQVRNSRRTSTGGWP
jgi:hypothetical protein